MSLVRALLLLILLTELVVWAHIGFSRTALLDEGYLHVRSVESIRQAGGTYVHPADRAISPVPVYDYVMVLLSFFMSVQHAFALVGVLLIAVLIGLTYWVVVELGVGSEAALLAGVGVGAIPALVWSVVGVQILLPIALSLLMLLLLVRYVPHTSFVVIYVLVLCALIFSHPIYLLLMCALVVYIFFIKVEGLRHTIGEFELVFFTVLLCSWFSLVIFRSALFSFGTDALVGNTPAMLRSGGDIIGALGKVGPVPFVLGLYALFRYVFRRKEKHVYLLVSMLLVLFFAIGLGMLHFNYGVLFAAILLCILAAFSWRDFFVFLEKTHMSHLSMYFKLAALMLLVVSSAVIVAKENAALVAEQPSQSDVDALRWLSQNIPREERVLGLYDEGNLIAALSGHPVVIDSAFLAQDSPMIYEETQSIYTTYETDAVRLLNKYGVSILYYSERAQKHIPKPEYLNNERCFVQLYSNGAQLYRVACTVIET